MLTLLPRPSFFAKFVKILALAAAGLLPSLTQAAVLIQYDFTGLISDDTILQPAAIDPNVSGSTITAAGFGTKGANWGGSESQENLFVRGDVTSTTFSTSDYFEFTLTPLGGVEMDLSSLTFTFINHQGFGGTFTTNTAIRSDLDSFSTDIPPSPSPITITRTSNGISTLAVTLDLSGAAYQNLTSAVTFRQYIWDNQANTNQITRVDTWTINGTAVPEPSCAALFALGAIALTMRRVRDGVGRSSAGEIGGRF